MTEGISVRELLPPETDGIERSVKEHLAKSAEANGGFPDFVWDAVGSKVSEAVTQSLDRDVFGLLAQAWCRAKELHEFTDTKKYPPGKESTVFLGKHDASTSVHPVVEVSFGRIKRSLRFTLELAAKFRSAALTIRSAHIVSISAGDCAVSAKLKYGDAVLHEAKSKEVKLSGPLTLEAPGLPLL